MSIDPSLQNGRSVFFGYFENRETIDKCYVGSIRVSYGVVIVTGVLMAIVNRESIACVTQLVFRETWRPTDPPIDRLRRNAP
jgi:hypothetical protein